MPEIEDLINNYVVFCTVRNAGSQQGLLLSHRGDLSARPFHHG
ncbi:MAG: hypothetical protein ACFFD4_12350 [Candidatus Odinarchaeota archaeon]